MNTPIGFIWRKRVRNRLFFIALVKPWKASQMAHNTTTDKGDGALAFSFLVIAAFVILKSLNLID